MIRERWAQIILHEETKKSNQPGQAKKSCRKHLDIKITLWPSTICKVRANDEDTFFLTYLFITSMFNVLSIGLILNKVCVVSHPKN